MDIDYDALLAQKRELDRRADELREAMTRLAIYRNDLNNSWDSKEMDLLNDVIDRMERKLGSVADEINSISRDMLGVYEELLAEDEG